MDAPTPGLGDGKVHPRSGQWEFGVAADFDFAELSRTMRFVGTMMVVFGALSVLGGVIILVAEEQVLQAALSMTEGIIMIVIGSWTRGASESFHLITQTEGNDLDHLNNAIGDLRRIYRLQYWLFILAIVGVVVVLLLMLLTMF